MKKLFVVSVVVSMLFLYGNYGMAYEKGCSSIVHQCKRMMKLVPVAPLEEEVPTLAPVRHPIKKVLKDIARVSKNTVEKNREIRRHLYRYWLHRRLIRQGYGPYLRHHADEYREHVPRHQKRREHKQPYFKKHHG